MGELGGLQDICAFGDFNDSDDIGELCGINELGDLGASMTSVTSVHYYDFSVEIKHVKCLYHQCG